MSFFSDMFSARGANNRQQQQSDQLQRQFDQSRGTQRADITGGRDRALGMINPYIYSGNEALNAQRARFGFSGGAAQQREFQNSYLNDPGRQYREQYTNNLIRSALAKSNVGGQVAAGALGAGRIGAEEFGKDRARIDQAYADMAGRGQQASQFGAGLEFQTGQGLAGVEQNHNQLTGTNMVNNRNAQNQNSANANRNILGAAGLVGNFFMPGAGGASAAGNLFGGVNNLLSRFGGRGGGTVNGWENNDPAGDYPEYNYP